MQTEEVPRMAGAFQWTWGAISSAWCFVHQFGAIWAGLLGHGPAMVEPSVQFLESQFSAPINPLPVPAA